MLHGNFRGVPDKNVDPTQVGNGMVGEIPRARAVAQIDGVIAYVVDIRMIHQPFRSLLEYPFAA